MTRLLLKVDDLGFIVAVLGGFRLLRGTSVVGVPGVSQRLLAFWHFMAGSSNGPRFVDTLWPDSSERHAYSNLRATFSRLESSTRKALVRASLSLASPRASLSTSATPKRSPRRRLQYAVIILAPALKAGRDGVCP